MSDPADATIASRPKTIGSAMQLALLCLIVFTPSALRYLFDMSSFAPGVAAVALLVWGAGIIGIVNGPRTSGTRHMAVVLISCGMIAAHVALTYVLGEPDLERPLTSLLLLAVILLASRQVGHTLFAADANHRFVLYAMLLIFALIAVLGLLGIAPPGATSLERPLFPFTEPSHYALTVMPFLIYAVVTSSQALRLVILAVVAVAVILLKSLSLAIGLVLAGACCLDGIALAIFLLISIVGVSVVDLSYFTDRLDFSYANENLSMLVYRQGAELIGKSLTETWGWGIGFQRLGFTDLFTVSSNIIYALTHVDLNLRDGGFTAAKVITEFGIAGLVLTVVYLAVMIRCIMMLRRLAGRRASLPDGIVFALSCFVGLAIELFVRGAGYFTSTALMAVAALPYIRSVYRKTTPHAEI